MLLRFKSQWERMPTRIGQVPVSGLVEVGDRERERRRGRARWEKLGPCGWRCTPVEAVDLAGDYRYDARGHFFAGSDPLIVLVLVVVLVLEL